MADDTAETLLMLTVDIVAAHVSNNNVALNDMPTLIVRVHNALAGLGSESEAAPQAQKPAVSVRNSVRPDHIVCLEDGRRMKMLKRHLSTDHGMTAADYRTKWNLPGDYPMVAPAYAEHRRTIAIENGLGRNGTGSKTRRAHLPKSKA